MYTMTDEEILTIVTPMVEEMQLGWDEDSYERFTSNLSGEFLQFMTRDEFDKQRGEIFPKLGKHTGLTFVHIHRNPTDVSVLWEMECTGRSMSALICCRFTKIKQRVVITEGWINF